MKTALVISGGGSKGAFAVGAIEYLWEQGYRFDLIAGTSTGALIAPLVAIGDIETLSFLYTSVTNKDIIQLNWRKFFWNAIYDTRPLEQLISRIISQENRYERLMASPVDILLCAVNLQTEAITYFTQRGSAEHWVPWRDVRQFVQCILASTNQPVLMPAIQIGAYQYVDGGIREVIPVNVAIQAQCERVFVISNAPEVRQSSEKLFKNILSVGPRALDLMSHEITINDIKQCCLQEIETVVIRPDVSLDMGGLEFNPEKMNKARLLGYEKAKVILCQ
jgi:NTE family protein